MSTAPAQGAAGPWPVVLVHGTRTSHSQWDLQLPALHAAGHRTAIPDLPGHGARRAEPFSLDGATAVIIAAVEQEHARTGLPVHLVGSSLGGMLSIHAAARLSGCGRALGSLTPCGAALQPEPWSARLYGWLMRAPDLVPGSGAGAVGPPFTWMLGQEGARAYVRGGRADGSVVVPAFSAVASVDLRADLRRVPVPVTFLHGTRDQLRLQEASFAAAAPRGRIELLPGADHLVNLSEPGRFTTALLRVLARAERERCEGPGRP